MTSPPATTLPGGSKAGVAMRILQADELSDEQAQIATSMLALSHGAQASTSTWVATQMFDCTPEEWCECLAALTDAGLIATDWLNPERVNVVWL
jgi:hypothetical protein